MKQVNAFGALTEVGVLNKYPDGIELEGKTAFTGIVPNGEITMDTLACMYAGNEAERYVIIVDDIQHPEGAIETKDNIMEFSKYLGLKTDVVIASNIMSDSVYKRLYDRMKNSIEVHDSKYSLLGLFNARKKEQVLDEIVNELVFMDYMGHKYGDFVKIGNPHEEKIDGYMTALGLDVNSVYVGHFGDSEKNGLYIVARMDGQNVDSFRIEPEDLMYADRLREFTEKENNAGAEYMLCCK